MQPTLPAAPIATAVPPEKSASAPSAPPVSPERPKTSVGVTIVTILLLLVFNLAGLIVMWVATSWSMTVKILVTVLSIIAVVVMSTWVVSQFASKIEELGPQPTSQNSVGKTGTTAGLRASDGTAGFSYSDLSDPSLNQAEVRSQLKADGLTDEEIATVMGLRAKSQGEAVTTYRQSSRSPHYSFNYPTEIDWDRSENTKNGFDVLLVGGNRSTGVTQVMAQSFILSNRTIEQAAQYEIKALQALPDLYVEPKMMTKTTADAAGKTVKQYVLPYTYTDEGGSLGKSSKWWGSILFIESNNDIVGVNVRGDKQAFDTVFTTVSNSLQVE